MPTPARRVLAIAKATCLRPIEHRLDPTPHASSGFGLGSPNRLKGLHDHRDVDIRDGHRTKRRIDVGRKGIRPLLCVLGIAPTSCVRVDVSLCALPECDRSRYLDLLRTILGFAFFQWINL